MCIRDRPEAPPACTLEMKIPAPMHSAMSAVIWPLAGLRRRLLPSVRVSKKERPSVRPPTPSGTKTQNAA